MSDQWQNKVYFAQTNLQNMLLFPALHRYIHVYTYNYKWTNHFVEVLTLHQQSYSPPIIVSYHPIAGNGQTRISGQ